MATSCFAAESRKAFDVPAGPAEKSLKTFSAQAGVEVVFATSSASNVKTNAVKGDLAPREALDHMLSGTGLIAEPNRQGGGLMVLRDPNGPRAALPASDRPPGRDSVVPSPAEVNRGKNSTADGGAIVLSPFEVKEATTGYLATNTMSGTRLNTSLEDLASSISVVEAADGRLRDARYQ